jgi:hypothetical protein
MKVAGRLSPTFPPSLKTKIRQWIISFYHLDPRWQILTFFNLVAREGADNLLQDSDDDDDEDDDDDVSSSYRSNRHYNHQHHHNININNRPSSAARLRPSVAQLLASIFDVTSVLTVWRPCSNEAMRKMMLGEGVGKGLDVKGKSAKKGLLSGYVPFLQIHREDHKKEIQPLPKHSDMRVYYKTEQQRDYVYDYLCTYYGQDRPAEAVETPRTTSGVPHLRMKKIDKRSPIKSWFGIQVPQRLFWNATVRPASIERPSDLLQTGRPSTPGFQDANMKTLNAALRQTKNRPIPVVVQTMELSQEEAERGQERQYNQNEKGTTTTVDDDDNHKDNTASELLPVFDETQLTKALDPKYLVMAYEEGGRVTPVVSDFDGFLLGWRREALWFGCNLPREQEDLMLWCVDQIETILEEQRNNPETDTWTCRWLDVLKRETHNGFHPEIPEYGFGDPKSYSIMEQAALRLRKTGAVRHGSECFNYYFPQEIDDVYLLISDTLRPVPWRYVTVTELQQILSQKIAEGFVFPLNPKWILCDDGWKKLYDELMSSDALYADLSKDVWYPPFSGVRERIDAIHKKHPHGFRRSEGRICRRGSVAQANKTGYSPLRQNLADGSGSLSGNSAFDLAELELDDYVRHSVKHTLARQIVEANLEEDLDECDDEDEDDDSICDDWDSTIRDVDASRRRSHESSQVERSTATAMDRNSSNISISRSAMSRGLTSRMSRRTLFKTQREKQKQEDGRYRIEDGEDDDDPELAAAKRVVSDRSSSAVEEDDTNNPAAFTKESSYGLRNEDEDEGAAVDVRQHVLRAGHRRVQTAPSMPLSSQSQRGGADGGIDADDDYTLNPPRRMFRNPLSSMKFPRRNFPNNFDS